MNLPGTCAALLAATAMFLSAAGAGASAIASPAPSAIATPSVAVSPSATPPTPAATATPLLAAGEDPAVNKLAHSLIAQAQSGKTDRSLFSDQMNAGLTPSVLASVAGNMAPLGTPKSIILVNAALTSAYKNYRYRVTWTGTVVDEIITLDNGGKIIGWFLGPPSDSPVPPPAPTLAPETGR